MLPQDTERYEYSMRSQKKTVVREQNNERRSDAQATQLPKYTPPSTTTTNNSSNNNYCSITFYALSAASSLIYVCLSLHSVVQTLIHSAHSWQTTRCAFFYNSASLCVCAARELRVCRSLCMCVACVCIGVCLLFQLL